MQCHDGQYDLGQAVDDRSPHGSMPCTFQDELKRCGSMATRSQTSQQARTELMEAIKELTSAGMVGTSSASLTVAHAAKEAALAAAAALCTDSQTMVSDS